MHDIVTISETPAWEFSAPDLALWHPASRTAVIADANIPTEDDRSRRGLSDADESFVLTERRLHELRHRLEPARLVVIGSLTNGQTSHAQLAHIAVLLSEYPWTWTIVGGAIERRAHDELLAATNVEMVEKLVVDDWTICRGDLPAPRPAVIGNEHPVVALRDDRGHVAARPALLVWNDLMVLPAFCGWSSGVDTRAILAGEAHSPMVRLHRSDAPPALYLATDAGATRYDSPDAL